MSCQQCGAACQGGLCKQCEIENAWEHKADDLASDDKSDADHDFSEAEPRDGRADEAGHADAVAAQLALAAENGTLPEDIDAPEDGDGDE